MASLSPTPKLQFFGSDGLPLVGGKLYTYAAGTTTPLATYTDHNANTENTNPVILDSNGEAEVWLPDTTSYKYILKDSDDVTLYTVDYISVPVTTNSFASPPVIGSGTPNAATFTTLNVTGAAIFESTADFTDPVTFDSDVSFTSTGAVKINVGTTAQRPASPVDGDIRYNTDTAKYEGYSGSAWGQLGGGATGGGSDTIFILNGQTVTTDYTIPVGSNAGTFGPVSIATGVTVTVSDGSVWSIV